MISPGGHLGFLSRYLKGPLPYVQRHLIVLKLLSASLNKTFPSILPIADRISLSGSDREKDCDYLSVLTFIRDQVRLVCRDTDIPQE